jgi:hypothetical protein
VTGVVVIGWPRLELPAGYNHPFVRGLLDHANQLFERLAERRAGGDLLEHAGRARR